MNPLFLETQFKVEAPGMDDWPAEFAIITAYATTGETWTDERNAEADRHLESRLRARGGFLRRITGYSPTGDHAEPGWAVEMGWEEAAVLGDEFLQEGVYAVTGDDLWVTYCDAPRRGLVLVGPFRERVTKVSPL